MLQCGIYVNSKFKVVPHSIKSGLDFSGFNFVDSTFQEQPRKRSNPINQKEGDNQI